MFGKQKRGSNGADGGMQEGRGENICKIETRLKEEEENNGY